MDNNSLMLLGMVKMQNPHTKQMELVEVKGFDVLGFFFPFLRLMFAGELGKGIVCLLVSFTIIGWVVSSWYIGFQYKKMNFESKLKSGWIIVDDSKQPQVTAAAA